MNYIDTIKELKLAKLFLVDTGIIEEEDGLDVILEMAEQLIKSEYPNWQIYNMEYMINGRIKLWVRLGSFL